MTGEEGDATAVALATADEVELDEEGNVVERDANGKKISLVEKQVEALGHTWALDHAENSSGPMLREYYAALKRPQPVESRYNTIAPPPSTQALFDAVALRSRAANKLAYLQLIKMRTECVRSSRLQCCRSFFRPRFALASRMQHWCLSSQSTSSWKANPTSNRRH